MGAYALTDLAPLLEPQAIEWSLGGSIVAIFAKTSSANYKAAVAAAKRADHYGEADRLHIAGFGRTPGQLALALFVIAQLQYSRTLKLFGGGKRMHDKYELMELLECIMTAGGCSDPKAHCVISVEEDRLLLPASLPQSIEIRLDSEPSNPVTFGLYVGGTRTFPCRYLFERGFKFQASHPSSEADQIQAGAVRAGCDWCPHLRRNPLALPVK